jgi:hypothetical protein
MSEQKRGEFCLIVEGDYADIEAAKHALHDPFVEDYVEATGKFRLHNFEDIRIAGGIALSDLEICELGDGIFEISCRSSPQILNRNRAEKLAETLRRQAMFDDIRIEALV